MRLGIKPVAFLLRLLLFFFLTYALWRPLEPVYTQLLVVLSRGFLHLTEVASEPEGAEVTEMRMRETAEGRQAIFYQHRRFPAVQSGIPAEWVQANMVLLIPLMLATPARTYKERFGRLAVALGVALALQVLDIALTVKALYASQLPGYGDAARRLYQFGDAFSQSMDTQLFPFAIWAGVHFKQLLGLSHVDPPPDASASSAQVHKSRRQRKPRRARG